MRICLEYIWSDGQRPTPELRSKTKIAEQSKVLNGSISDNVREIKLPRDGPSIFVPVWGFDGSSTEQAETESSDMVLEPVAACIDPIRSTNDVTHFLILNEVYHPSGEPHKSNTRVNLVQTCKDQGSSDFEFGLEQEYTLMNGSDVLGFPPGSTPAEGQGRYYCGVGDSRISGRHIVEEHMKACIKADLLISGINAEVMLGQWEYQIGKGKPLEVADQVLFAQWIAHRIGEDHGVSINLDPKPVEGDWNGTGAHINFSTSAMREGTVDWHKIVEALETSHEEHIAVYGHGNERRLTGMHETCAIDQFKYNAGARNVSIRMPWQVDRDGRGYLEDRRPAANVDPYLALTSIMKTLKHV